MVVFGYPTEQQLMREKPKRVAQKFIVYENSYPAWSEHDLNKMFSGKTGGRAYEDWMKAFCERKYNSAFSREMTRSVKKYLDDFTAF